MQRAQSKHCHFMTSMFNYNVSDRACGIGLLMYHPQMLSEFIKLAAVVGVTGITRIKLHAHHPRRRFALFIEIKPI